MKLSEKIEQELLENLNEVQKQAVLHEHGPLLILAGAGSGKTRVITHRIAHLIRVRGLRPYRIAAVTFTNKAAQEMKERLSSLIGPMAQDVMVKTFHSLGLYILRRNAAAAGLKSTFTVLDPDAQTSIIKAILKERAIDTSILDTAQAAHAIDRAKDSLITPEEMEKRTDHFSQLIAPLYRSYASKLLENNSVDFGDLLYLTVQILRDNPDILSDYQDRWQNFMIDEYQDTNKAQYMIGKLIASSHQNIAVVGDDDQSIYSWRGADISNILDFEKDYPRCAVLRLEENYRSTPDILKAASTVIAKNKDRREKTLHTKKPPGEKIRYILFDSEADEAAWVVQSVRKHRQEGLKYSQMAVFYRTNAQSRVFEEALRREGIPFVLVGGFRFFDRKEIRDIIAYLNVIVNPEDNLSLERIANVPPRGLGEAGITKLRDLSLKKGISLVEALGRADEIPGLRSSSKLLALYENFMRWRKAAEAGESPFEIARQVAEESGYLEHLSQDRSPESASRQENIQEFLSSIREYEERESEPTLSSYLQDISLYSSDTAAAETQKDPLYLMTLHNAKGLEFPVVFITGMEEGFLPHGLSVEDGNLEEERRLMYVGITRAMKKLTLSGCRYRRIFGSYQPRIVARFLAEMDTGLIEKSGTETLMNRYPPSAGMSSTGRMSGNSEDYRAGQRIEHEKYGRGVVIGSEKTPAGLKVAIQFDQEARTRFFLAGYTNLRKIED